MKSYLVAVGVGEGKCPTKRAVARCGNDGVAINDQSIVDGLYVCGVEPDRDAYAGLSNGREVGTRNDVAERKCNRRRFEDDGVRGSGRRADETEILLVERL